MSFIIEKDHYSVSATAASDIIAESDNKVASEIWFRTPALEQTLLDKVEQIQLETKSRDQGFVDFPDAGSWSWFEIVVLESPEASEPKVKDGLALVWLSHENKLGEEDYETQLGPVLDENHDIFSGLEAGNALGVRVCARFPGWENHASQGRLVLKISEKVRVAPAPTFSDIGYLEIVKEQIVKLEETFDTYLNAATPADAPPAYSLVRDLLPTGALYADQAILAVEPPLRLMSLDGGGVRGISSLYILQAIMAKVANDPNAKPCKYFDMIAGTSTGGLIAIMLGRLQMTIPECIEAYISLASSIFSANMAQRAWNFSHTGAYYKKDDFEKGLKDLIKRKTGDENAPMLDPDANNGCKVFVVSGQSQNLNHTSAEQFRTYSTRFPDQFAGCTIWQAARATSAAPTYLPAIEINGVEFIDGGIRFNNPAILLMGEVNAVFGTNNSGFGIARHIGCFLTVGTGMQPNTAMEKQPTGVFKVAPYAKSIAEATIKVATDCETTHNLAQNLFYGKENVYFRFNAGVRQGNDWAPMINLDDYENMPSLVALTQTYLAVDEQVKRLGQCASTLGRNINKSTTYEDIRWRNALLESANKFQSYLIDELVELSKSSTATTAQFEFLYYVDAVARHHLGSKRNFASLCKAFVRDLNRPVYALDLRNHGSSPHAAPMTYESMAADVKRFIEKSSLNDVSLFGHSMGGKVAMTLALSSSLPSLSKLIISDIAPTRSSLAPSFIRYLKIMADIEDPTANITTREGADKVLQTVEKDLGVRQFLLTNLVLPSNSTVKFKIPVATLEDAVPALGSFPFMIDEGHQWRGRTLVVKGAKSE
ncbi:hypothetical protein DXG03_001239 [Asterophora parasitica]|uniref:PNPLA domain-containing protein n=1 Tax=Asterophora parasitica TaxID=117018 RepID=A0A9P7GA41_9AGAR|nr:hypothetical protein DXG03_001239 [Asterophora parasitica]